jgi:hypothetical protein
MAEGSKINIARTWKEENGFQSYFNFSSSPDFAPIEKAWQGPKQYVKKRPWWDDDDIVREIAEEGWAAVE